MTDHGSQDRQRAHELMMAALDGEASAADRSDLEALLQQSPELAGEWRRLTRVREVTTGMTLERLPEEVWDRYWISVYRRAERGIAWILVTTGATILLGYWLWHMVEALFTDTSMPSLVRVAVFAIALGAIILVLSVIRERLFVHRRDPYKEIIR